MKVREILNNINSTEYWSLNEAVKAVNLTRSDCVSQAYPTSSHQDFDMMTNIYRADDGFVAITGLINDKAKRGYQSYGITSFAEEYEEIQIINYRPKYRR